MWPCRGQGSMQHWALCVLSLTLGLLLPALLPSAASPSRLSEPLPAASFDSTGGSRRDRREYVCRSLDVWGTLGALRELANCTVVEGRLQVRLLESHTAENLAGLSFPRLVEITDYLIVYRVLHLRSLGQLFPNLAVIRGQQLFTKYAMVIFENPDLEELGLKSLRSIVSGAVRVENNPRLCYTATLDWSLIAQATPPAEHYIQGNMPLDLCPLDSCPRYSQGGEACGYVDVGGERGGRGWKSQPLCWDQDHCQTVCPSECKERLCYEAPAATFPGWGDTAPGRAPPLRCCDEQCLGGCTGPTRRDCAVCAHVRHLGACQAHCPPGLYAFLGRRCIDNYECRNVQRSESSSSSSSSTAAVQWKPLSNGACSPECPPGFTENEKRRHECVPCPGGKCPKKCRGSREGIVDSLQAASKFHGCTVIEGSLEIAIRGGELLEWDLTEHLGQIEEVTWFVRVIYSSALHSLSFFKNLRVIRGERLYQNRALFILDNPNLQDVWDVNANFTIKNGKVFMLDNPKLCMYKIRDFLDRAGVANQTEETDILPSSNGNQISCNDTNQLNVSVVLAAARHAVVQWEAPTRSDALHWSSWVINYRKVPEESPSSALALLTPEEQCSVNVWKTVDVNAPDARHDASPPHPPTLTFDLRGLQPFTRYVAYVQAYSSVERGAISPFTYFNTTPAEPTRVQSVVALRATALIVVSWVAPLLPHGDVTHYVVRWRAAQPLLQPRAQQYRLRDYCARSTSKAGMDTAQGRGGNLPLPSEKHLSTAAPPGGSSGPPTPPNKCNCTAKPCCACPRTKEEVRAEEEERRFQKRLLEKHVLSESSNRRYFEKVLDATIHNLPHSNGIVSAPPSSNPFKPPHPSNNSNISHHPTPSNGHTHQYSGVTSSVGGVVSGGERVEGVLSPSEWTTVVVRDSMKYTMSNLRHFQEYIIEVSACHDPVNGSSKLCSVPATLAARTLASVSFDKIDERNVSVDVDVKWGENRVRLTWPEPLTPNGLILAYELELDRSDIYMPHKVCIASGQYHNASGGFVLGPLQPGEWSFRLQAVSLAGNGSWTPSMHFFISEVASQEQVPLVATLSLTCVAVIVIILAFSVYIIWKKKQMNIIQSWNPNYLNHDNVYIKDEWEMPREDLVLETSPLGQGSFGNVYRGVLRTGLEKRIEIKVAVKTVNESASNEDRIAFLQEASVMKGLDCRHVVKLFGIVSIGLPNLVVMELMAHGDLKNFLRRRRPGEQDCVGPPPTLKETLQMAGEMADGMAYLASCKLVHRDLAARNCMVSDEMIVKIGDFGLTRDIYSTDYYRKSSRGLLPIRWMAPESLKDGIFSIQSDVWSYGVVMWEMATLAAQPYQGMSNEKVLVFVIGGGIMDVPTTCPMILRRLMLDCWRPRSDARPTFESIIDSLEPHLSTRFRSDSFHFQRALPNTSTPIAGDSTLVDAGLDGSDVISSGGTAHIAQIDTPPKVSLFGASAAVKQCAVTEPAVQCATTDRHNPSDRSLRLLHTLHKCGKPPGVGNTYSPIPERANKLRPSSENSALSDSTGRHGGRAGFPFPSVSGGFLPTGEAATTYSPISARDGSASKAFTRVASEGKPRQHFANSLAEKCGGAGAGSKSCSVFGSKSGPVFGSKSGPVFGLVNERKQTMYPRVKKSKHFRPELNSQGSENHEAQRAEFVSLLPDSEEEGQLEAEPDLDGGDGDL